MIYIVWYFLGILSFLRKNNIFVSGLLVLFILCVFCFNTSNPDLYNYQNQYYGYAVFYTEPLFCWLERFFNGMDLSYEFFRFVIVSVSLFLMVNTIYKYSPYPTFVLFLYTIYPLTMDVVQLRFFVGWTIVLFAVRFIVDYQTEKKINYILLYFLFVVLAGCCHYACLLYGVLGLTFLNINKHKLLYFIVIPLCFVLLLVSIQRFAPLIAIIVGGEKAYLWVERVKVGSVLNTLRILVASYIPLLLVVAITWCKRNAEFQKAAGVNVPFGLGMLFYNVVHVIKHSNNGFYSFSTNGSLFLCLFYIELFSFLQIMVAADYERMTRAGLMIGAILISRLIFYTNNNNRMILIGLCFLMFLSIFSLFTFFETLEGISRFPRVFRPVMENNSLFNMLF